MANIPQDRLSIRNIQVISSNRVHSTHQCEANKCWIFKPFLTSESSFYKSYVWVGLSVSGSHKNFKNVWSCLDFQMTCACKYAGMQVCKNTSMQVCKSAGMQVCKHASMQVEMYKSMQVCRHAGIPVCKYASM